MAESDVAKKCVPCDILPQQFSSSQELLLLRQSLYPGDGRAEIDPRLVIGAGFPADGLRKPASKASDQDVFGRYKCLR